MIRFIGLTFAFSCVLAFSASAQEKYNVSGSVNYCYENEHKTIVSTDNLTIVLSSLTSDIQYKKVTDANGKFKFSQVPAGSYKLKTSTLGFPDNDTTIVVNYNINDLAFCIDNAYRPVSADAISNYKNKALKDIASGQTRIYEWTALSLTEDPFKNLNPEVKKKYGFEYEMMGCVRPTTRQEIVQLKLWEAYNEVVYDHLTKVHGPNWRKALKHERIKIRNAK